MKPEAHAGFDASECKHNGCSPGGGESPQKALVVRFNSVSASGIHGWLQSERPQVCACVRQVGVGDGIAECCAERNWKQQEG